MSGCVPDLASASLSSATTDADDAVWWSRAATASAASAVERSWSARRRASFARLMACSMSSSSWVRSDGVSAPRSDNCSCSAAAHLCLGRTYRSCRLLDGASFFR